MIIRPLANRDILQCVEIVRLTFAKPEVATRAFTELSDALRHPILEAYHYVAFSKGQLCGFAGFMRSRKMRGEYDFTFLATRPDFQGHGVGRTLTEHRLAEIERFGGSLVELCTRVPSFFTQFGFSETRCYGEFTTMVKQLSTVSL